MFSSQSSSGGLVNAPFLSDNDNDVVDNGLDGDISDDDMIILWL